MKRFRNVCLSLLALFILSSAGGYLYFKRAFKAPLNQLVIPEGAYQVPFIWKADSLNGKASPNAAMLLPVTVPGCSKIFYMQFDLGAPYSLVYKGKLKAIAERTSGVTIQETESGAVLKDFRFKVGSMDIRAEEVNVLAYGNETINWADTASIDIIGTLGADVIDRKVLVLNYPQALMQFSDEVPTAIAAEAVFTTLAFEERRVIIPAVINQKETQVLFDSGSSAFELLTDRETWLELAKNKAAESITAVNSWGNTLTVHSIASDKNINFGQTALPLRNVHYIDGTTFMQRTLMQFSGMAGMVGNTLFLGKVIVLDTKHRRFGIVK
ncbi:hypothetical protein [Pontibacter akesuensis]|uniref:Aspartyl protease n=1 Tax=Pontibacter akesuensis TaxID=388950 RepID=A0A1I7K3A4_9BACT|nr:hypothetical protein [Pontibacter akesuensis]GHA75434.1 hypothetical protein GCM10007389_31620 [Pontibacter akesuensis]SFU91870.1 hypothetical protein SAMN04487941_3341 [Pontibacter akesuensis]